MPGGGRYLNTAANPQAAAAIAAAERENPYMQMDGRHRRAYSTTKM